MTCECGHAMQSHAWVPYRRAHCGICLDCGRPSGQHDFVTTHQVNRCPCDTYTPGEGQQ